MKMQPNKLAPRANFWRRSLYFILTVGILSVLFILAWFLYPQSLEVDSIPATAPLPFICQSDQPVKNVAIIGAGSAGSSAAYYLNEFTRQCSGINITIFERSSYVGGRSTTVNAHGCPLEPVELGASIFVKVNHNLMSAVERSGLSTQAMGASSDMMNDEDEEEEEDDLGVWDGHEWVYYQSDKSPSWWNAVKIIWKYGLAPLRTRNLMKSVVSRFLKMYSEPHFPFPDLSAKAFELDLVQATAVTGEQFLATHNIGEAFGRDLIQASTRVNYAQNLDNIHGLETMVCMATDGAMSVQGGNWQIFAGMIQEAGANLVLNTSVTQVQMNRDGKYLITTSGLPGLTEFDQTETIQYDSVILAAPYQFAGLNLNPKPLNPPSAIPYVQLHVTLFTSPFLMKPALFNMGSDARVPSVILTTTPSEATDAGATGQGSTRDLDFYSISRLRALRNPNTGAREYLYKIFSPQPLSRMYVRALMDTGNPSIAPLGKDADTSSGNRNEDAEHHEEDSGGTDQVITWIYYKLWHSYPVELPRVTFESTSIELDSASEAQPGIDLDGKGRSKSNNDEQTLLKSPTEHEGGKKRGKLWYTAGIESFISTMETSSLMGMNIARLIADEWIADQDSGRKASSVEKQEQLERRKDDL